MFLCFFRDVYAILKFFFTSLSQIKGRGKINMSVKKKFVQKLKNIKFSATTLILDNLTAVKFLEKLNVLEKKTPKYLRNLMEFFFLKQLIFLKISHRQINLLLWTKYLIGV